MKKALTFLLILSISAATLAGCKKADGSDTTATSEADSAGPADPGASGAKTPEEVYGDILAHRDNLRMIMISQSASPAVSMKITQDYSFCGNMICTKATTEMLGESETVENYYVKTDTGTRLYFQENGSWYHTSVPDEDFDVLADFENEENARMFSSDYYGSYDPETGRYPLTDYSFGEDVEIPGVEVELQEGWLELGEGIYTIHFVLAVAGQQTTSDMVFTDFGKVELTLPTAVSYTEPDETAPDSTTEAFVPPTIGEIRRLFQTGESCAMERSLYVGEDCVDYVHHGRMGDRHETIRWENGNELWSQHWTLDGKANGYDFYDGAWVYNDAGELVGTRFTKSEISSEQAQAYLPVYDDLLALMRDDYYEAFDPETGLYVMKEDASVKFGEYGSVSGVCVRVEEPFGWLTVTFIVPVVVDGNQGRLEFELSRFHELIVTLPDMN